MAKNTIVKKLLEVAKENSGSLENEDIKKLTGNSLNLYTEVYQTLISSGVDIYDEDDFIELSVSDFNLALIDVKELEEAIVDEPLKSVNYSGSKDILDIYFHEISKYNLLTAEEEVILAIRIEEGKLAKKELENISNIKENEKLIIELEQKIDDGKEARIKMIEANYRLVVSIAKKHDNRGINLADLIQEGNLGLIKAVDKFDYTKGYKFSTYATWWIRQAVTRLISDQARTIRIPVHMVEKINRLIRFQRQLLQELKREPTDEELALSLDITIEEVRNIKRISQETLSLETPVGDEEDSTLGDFISDRNTLTPAEEAEKEWLKMALDDLLGTLTDREEKILRMRFGLLDGKRYTLEETGNEFEVTRERIRQIEKKAIRKLRRNSIQRKLDDFTK